MTEDRKCAFNNTLKGDQFGCQYGKPVVRKGGLEVACTGENVNERCALLFENMKNAVLPELGLQDDLLSIPHSVLVKVQFGGLLGLQRKYGAAGPQATRVENINELVTTALKKCGDLDSIPYQEFIGDISGYRLPKRSRG
ncbi:MAG: hypothetical protein V3S33_06870 [Gammaproteobacteria bacterium]